MSYWGKLVGSVAGFAVGGPFGAVMGAALGHAADTGAINTSSIKTGSMRPSFLDPANMHPARIASLFTPKEHLFALSVVSLAAKLAKCDGPVNRAEIDAFKRHFRIPPENARNVGRLFDQARSSADEFEPYATKLGEAFADNKGLLEDVLGGLFGIARADGTVNDKELQFLSRTARALGLGGDAWDRARQGQARTASGSDDADPYAILGVKRDAPDDAVRAAWKTLMRENHPDSLASRGVPKDFIDRAGAKVARINAAWDRVKRDRGI
jgi:DnaJ like chaperone protein